MNDIHEFETLEAWKNAREFRKETSRLAETFPFHEKFELTKQIRRSSRSVTANIAEGNGRYFFRDNHKFVRIASGSLKETMDHLYVAFDEKYITEDQLKEIKGKYDHCKRILNGYLAYLKTRMEPKKK